MVGSEELGVRLADDGEELCGALDEEVHAVCDDADVVEPHAEEAHQLDERALDEAPVLARREGPAEEDLVGDGLEPPERQPGLLEGVQAGEQVEVDGQRLHGSPLVLRQLSVDGQHVRVPRPEAQQPHERGEALPLGAEGLQPLQKEPHRLPEPTQLRPHVLRRALAQVHDKAPVRIQLPVPPRRVRRGELRGLQRLVEAVPHQLCLRPLQAALHTHERLPHPPLVFALHGLAPLVEPAHARSTQAIWAVAFAGTAGGGSAGDSATIVLTSVANHPSCCLSLLLLLLELGLDMLLDLPL